MDISTHCDVNGLFCSLQLIIIDTKCFLQNDACNFAAAEFAKLPLIPPYLQPGNRQFINGVNFASGGAGALVETNQRRVCGPVA
jgi:hypothetical protein